MQLQRVLTSVAALAIALAAPPATSRHQQEPPAVAGDHTLVGLPVFTSDGHSVGMVIAVGTDESNEAVLVAQIERPLGFGSDLVAIPMKMFIPKADRIELTITERELRNRATRSSHK
jgi:hypothetical protein